MPPLPCSPLVCSALRSSSVLACAAACALEAPRHWPAHGASARRFFRSPPAAGGRRPKADRQCRYLLSAVRCVDRPDDLERGRQCSVPVVKCATRTPLVITSVAVVLNTALGLVLVLGRGSSFGVAGAGLATLISQSCRCLALIIALYSSNKRRRHEVAAAGGHNILTIGPIPTGRPFELRFPSAKSL
jgi:hypothetical protein